MKTNSTLFVDYLCIPAELVFCYWFSKHSPLDPNLQKYQISHKFTAFVCLKLILPFSILLLGFQTKNIVVHNDYYTIWIWHTRSKCKLVVFILFYDIFLAFALVIIFNVYFKIGYKHISEMPAYQTQKW